MWEGRICDIVVTKHKIELKPSSVHNNKITYRQDLVRRNATSYQIRQQIDSGIIEPSKNEWESHVVLVTKKDGLVYFCVKYRRINAGTVPD